MIRRATTSASLPGGGSESKRIGASMPASRRTTASSTSATASQSAPAPSAARATGTEPCPYASAFTTAHANVVCAQIFSARTLWAIASRSTVATVGR